MKVNEKRYKVNDFIIQSAMVCSINIVCKNVYSLGWAQRLEWLIKWKTLYNGRMARRLREERLIEIFMKEQRDEESLGLIITNAVVLDLMWQNRCLKSASSRQRPGIECHKFIRVRLINDDGNSINFRRRKSQETTTRNFITRNNR